MSIVYTIRIFNEIISITTNGGLTLTVNQGKLNLYIKLDMLNSVENMKYLDIINLILQLHSSTSAPKLAYGAQAYWHGPPTQVMTPTKVLP